MYPIPLMISCIPAIDVQDVLRVVNEGTMKQLLQLHGIGKKRAEGIIENRPFSKVEIHVLIGFINE